MSMDEGMTPVPWCTNHNKILLQHCMPEQNFITNNRDNDVNEDCMTMRYNAWPDRMTEGVWYVHTQKSRWHAYDIFKKASR